MRLEVAIRGHRRVVDVTQATDGLVVHIDDGPVPLRLRRAAGEECWRLEMEEATVPVRFRVEEEGVGVTIGAAHMHVGVRRALPIASRRPADAGGEDRVEVRAHMPGLIVAVPVEIGSAVRPGEPVAVVEAMKMQMEVPSPVPGCLAEIRVRPGQEVAGGQVLVVVLADGTAMPAETRS